MKSMTSKAIGSLLALVATQSFAAQADRYSCLVIKYESELISKHKVIVEPFEVTETKGNHSLTVKKPIATGKDASKIYWHVVQNEDGINITVANAQNQILATSSASAGQAVNLRVPSVTTMMHCDHLGDYVTQVIEPRVKAEENSETFINSEYAELRIKFTDFDMATLGESLKSEEYKFILKATLSRQQDESAQAYKSRIISILETMIHEQDENPFKMVSKRSDLFTKFVETLKAQKPEDFASTVSVDDLVTFIVYVRANK